MRRFLLCLAIVFLASPSCQLVKDYSESVEQSSPVILCAAGGAAIGGPVGAAIGGGIGAIIQHFRGKVIELRRQNDDLLTGRIVGNPRGWQPSGMPNQPGAIPFREVVPWYLQPFTMMKIAIGWGIILLVVFVLVWRFGHPAFKFLAGLLTLGVAPLLASVKDKNTAVRRMKT